MTYHICFGGALRCLTANVEGKIYQNLINLRSCDVISDSPPAAHWTIGQVIPEQTRQCCVQLFLCWEPSLWLFNVTKHRLTFRTVSLYDIIR